MPYFLTVENRSYEEPQFETIFETCWQEYQRDTTVNPLLVEFWDERGMVGIIVDFTHEGSGNVPEGHSGFTQT